MHDYDDHLKLHDRVLSPSLGAPAAAKFQPLMEYEARQLLSDLATALRKSTDGSTITTKTIYPLLERTQSSVILALHYGLRIPKFEEPLLHEVIAIRAKVTHFAANSQLPDLVPFLRYLPAFISPWQKYADKLYASQVDLYMRLFRLGKGALGCNATKQAITTASKHAPVNSPVSDLDLAFMLATSIQGGMERFSDRNNLVYVDVVAHELFRWRPVSPGSIPRRVDRTDKFDGVKITKDVPIMADAWTIGRDEVVFDASLGDAQDFVPELWLCNRKLRDDLPLPVFGKGRRICQGKRVATDETFMNIAHLLWAFDVEALEGEEVDP
ncbi:unnamed protein product [Alternaria sp. RS040]